MRIKFKKFVAKVEIGLTFAATCKTIFTTEFGNATRTKMFCNLHFVFLQPKLQRKKGRVTEALDFNKMHSGVLVKNLYTFKHTYRYDYKPFIVNNNDIICHKYFTVIMMK